MATTTSSAPITVIGAGVLGLSAATVLQKRHPRNPITILAAELPSLPSTWDSSGRPSADLASAWAGAHYRPIPRSTRQLEDEMDLAFVTAKRMLEIAEKSPEAGVAVTPAVEYLEDPPQAVLELQSGIPYAGPDDRFRILNKSELPEGCVFGCSYDAYCVNVHVYCCWLLDQFVKNGGLVEKRRLESIEEAFDPASIVINCSGRNFDVDPQMKIIRGQTVLVRNEYHSTVTRQNRDGSWSFLIPRPGGVGTVVGGTKEIGDEDTQARPETRRKLLENAVRYFPDFVDDISKFEVVMDNVGRRPWREGGLRIESELLSETRKIIHGYGAGGRGYELSWGIADRIADLYDKV